MIWKKMGVNLLSPYEIRKPRTQTITPIALIVPKHLVGVQKQMFFCFIFCGVSVYMRIDVYIDGLISIERIVGVRD